MTNQPQAFEVTGHFVGEFVDDVGPSNVPPGTAEVDRTRIVADFVDDCAAQPLVKDFTVLLHDRRIVTVRGCGLKLIQNEANPADSGSYAILAPGGTTEIVVAFFPVREVTGIFSGQMQAVGSEPVSDNRG